MQLVTSCQKKTNANGKPYWLLNLKCGCTKEMSATAKRQPPVRTKCERHS